MARVWSRLKRNDSGAVAPTVGLSLFALLATGGIAFDYARMATMDTELQAAADQAALAAASQLDGQANACARATAAAANMLANKSLLANETASRAITVTETGEDTCDGTGVVQFYQSYTQSTDTPGADATTNANAKVVMVRVNSRQARFALTPIVGAFNSTIDAEAVASVSSSICKVPPLMICNPSPGTAFDADGLRGHGIQVTGHGNDRSGTGAAVTAWAPGDFGFLEMSPGQNSDLVKAIAFQSPGSDCFSTITGRVTTGNPQALYDALNTRFDIYDFSSGNGTTLAPCFSGSCPAAINVVKDLVKADTTTNGNSCKIHNSGWKLPTNQFSPRPAVIGDTLLTQIDSDGLIDAMGLPRDNCHYSSFGSACTNGRVGDGKWARGDFFNKYHSGSIPANASTMTRYETYLWEINQGGSSRIPHAVAAGTSGNQYGRPVCSTGSASSGTDRRVLSVAIVENCSSLSGTSQPVTISEWVDMFLVEPTTDDRGNGAPKDSIYMEVIGKTSSRGNTSVAAQTIRHDVPYLLK